VLTLDEILEASEAVRMSVLSEEALNFAIETSLKQAPHCDRDCAGADFHVLRRFAFAIERPAAPLARDLQEPLSR
jgi:hypothetical protein